MAYCKNCGHRGVTKLDGLVNPCESLQAYGRANLEAIHNNKLPPNMNNWPDELATNPIKSSSLSLKERAALRGVEAFIHAEQSNIKRRRTNQHIQPIAPNIPLAITNTASPAINEEVSSGSD